MHIQIRTLLKAAAFTDDLDSAEGSVDYPRGSLQELLSILADDRSDSDPGFNLAAASGHDIELGGEFTFWVDPRDGIDANHDAATLAALARIQGLGYEANGYHVESRHLTDAKGALRDFVMEVTNKGLHVVEISVGALEDDGVPVQIYTAKIS